MLHRLPPPSVDVRDSRRSKLFDKKGVGELVKEKSPCALEPGGVTMRRRIPLIKRRQDLISKMLAPSQ